MILFLGIELPDSMKRYLSGFSPEATNALKPTNPTLMHITLHYLGDTDPKPIQTSIHATLQSYPILPFQLHLTGLDYFGPKSKPAVFLAAPNKSVALIQLHDYLSGVVQSLNHRLDERSYNPHITLARGRWRRSPTLQEQEIIHRFGQQVVEERTISVSHFVLFESRNTEAGREYVIVERFPLTGVESKQAKLGP